MGRNYENETASNACRCGVQSHPIRYIMGEGLARHGRPFARGGKKLRTGMAELVSSPTQALVIDCEPRGRHEARGACPGNPRGDLRGQTGLGNEVRPMMVADGGSGPHRLAKKRREGPAVGLFCAKGPMEKSWKRWR